MEKWKIRLLGELKAEQGSKAITQFRTQKTAALLAYLAVHLHRAHRREVLIDRFWPESGLSSGRHNLSLALTALRQQLKPEGGAGDEVILANRDTVQLNPRAVTTDVEEFHEALQAASLALTRAEQAEAVSRAERAKALGRAVDLYRGPLLPGVYENWFMSDQQRLADRFFQAVRELLPILGDSGEGDRALEVARRVVSLDPLREEAHVELMCLLADSGDAAGALVQYGMLERLLREQLETTPSAETRELADQIRSGSRVPSPAARHRRNPSGTVTFLVTQADPDADLPASRVNRPPHHPSSSEVLLREVRNHGGHSLEAAGSQVTVVFHSAGEALLCAINTHRELIATARVARAALPAPIALHSGDVASIGKDDSAPTLLINQGLLLAAHPGQLLCCEATAALAQPHLPPGVSLRDLGIYQLREVERPERVFQVDYPDMPLRTFPPPHAQPL